MKNLINFLKLFVILFFLSGSVFAQVTQEWVALYTGTNNTGAAAFGMVIDASGSIYCTGAKIVSGMNDCDYFTIKYNSSGVQQWLTTYNGPGNSNDQAFGLAIDASGNTYVSGFSVGSGTRPDFCTIKYNASGVQQWVARYDGVVNDTDRVARNSIGLDGSGNVYVTGSSKGNGTGYDIVTIKYNNSGAQQWVVRYNGVFSNKDAPNALVVDNSGNVYLTGYTDISGADYCTIKYNTSGVQQWIATYNGPGNNFDDANSIALDNAGNVYVTGTSYGNGTGGDYCTIKYNSSGAPQWEARYDGFSTYQSDEANFVTVDNSGNVYVTGHSASTSGPSPRDICTIKYNSSGSELWVAWHNGPNNDDDEGEAIALDANGNVYVTGSSEGIGTKEDFGTIKYNSSGVQQWIMRYVGSNDNDEPQSIVLDNSGNVYVAGYFMGGTITSAVIKYSQQIGIKTISTEIPSSFSLSQNYPNPFNPNTKIQFELPKNNYVTLKIYDALGREIEILINEKLVPGTYEVDWNGSNYPSGVYFYKLKGGDFIETKKMVLVK